MSSYDLIADLPLEIEGSPSRGSRSRSRGVHARHHPDRAPRRRRAGMGEDVTYDGLDHVAFQAEGRRRCRSPARARSTRSRSTRRDSTLFPSAARARRRVAPLPALGLRVGGAGPGAAPGGPLARRRARPRAPAASTSWSRCGWRWPPRRARDSRPPAARCSSTIPAPASSSTPPTTGPRSWWTSWPPRGAVDSLDLKGFYRGTPVDVVTDPELYRMVIEAFPDAWIEDPDVTDETRPILEPVSDRVTWDAPIHSVADIEARALAAADGQHQAVALRPAAATFRHLRLVRARGVRGYGGGQTELGVGRDHIQYLASLFHPDTPNDTAPAASTTLSCPRACPRARWSRASRRPASAGSSDRGVPAPPGGQTADEMARRVAGFLSEARRRSTWPCTTCACPAAGRPGGGRAARCRATRGGGAHRLQRGPPRGLFPPPPSTKPELIEALPFPTRASRGSPTSCTTSTWCATGRRSGPGPRTGPPTPGRSRRTWCVTAVGAPELAAAFTRNFEELWSTRNVSAPAARSRARSRWAGTRCARGSRRGTARTSRTGSPRRSGGRARRVRIASPVLTAGPGDRHAGRGRGRGAGRPEGRGGPHADGARCSTSGATNGRSAWKIPILAAMLATRTGAASPPPRTAPDTPHDFMHAKVTVADDVVFAGSFNLSRSGEMNAENVRRGARPGAGRPAGRVHRRGPRPLRGYACP